MDGLNVPRVFLLKKTITMTANSIAIAIDATTTTTTAATYPDLNFEFDDVPITLKKIIMIIIIQ